MRHARLELGWVGHQRSNEVGARLVRCLIGRTRSAFEHRRAAWVDASHCLWSCCVAVLFA